VTGGDGGGAGAGGGGAGGRYRMWTVLLRLLQDEDEQVRHVASQSLNFITQLDSQQSPAGKFIHSVLV